MRCDMLWCDVMECCEAWGSVDIVNIQSYVSSLLLLLNLVRDCPTLLAWVPLSTEWVEQDTLECNHHVSPTLDCLWSTLRYLLLLCCTSRKQPWPPLYGVRVLHRAIDGFLIGLQGGYGMTGTVPGVTFLYLICYVELHHAPCILLYWHYWQLFLTYTVAITSQSSQHQHNRHISSIHNIHNIHYTHNTICISMHKYINVLCTKLHSVCNLLWSACIYPSVYG